MNLTQSNTIHRELDRMRDWSHRLDRLQSEIEKAQGEPEPGLYDDKLATLVRYALEQSYDEIKRLERRLGVRWPA